MYVQASEVKDDGFSKINNSDLLIHGIHGFRNVYAKMVKSHICYCHCESYLTLCQLSMTQDYHVTMHYHLSYIATSLRNKILFFSWTEKKSQIMTQIYDSLKIDDHW